MKLIVDKIDILLFNQRSNYLLIFDEIKMRLSQELRLLIFRNLISFITLFALRKIFQKYKTLTTNSTILFRCFQSYFIKSDLSCKHIVQTRIFKSSNVIKLKNVYFHWRFIKSIIILINLFEFDDSNNAVSNNANAVSNDVINFLLLIQNPSICKSKERFVEALNRFRREASNILTHRESSEFELVDRSF